MRKLALALSVAAIVISLVVIYELNQVDDGYTTTEYGSKGENTVLVTFDSAYSQHVVFNQPIYIPDGSLAGLQKNNQFLAYWTMNGSVYYPGDTYKPTGNVTFVPKWISYDNTGSTYIDCTLGNSFSKTINFQDRTVFGNYLVFNADEPINSTYYRNFSIEEVNGKMSSANVKLTSGVGTYTKTLACNNGSVSISYDSYKSMTISGTLSEGLYKFTMEDRDAGSGVYKPVVYILVHPGLPSKEVVLLDNKPYGNSIPYGTAIVLPEAGKSGAPENLAWWIADIYGTGEEVYHLPKTTVSVTKDMSFNAQLKGAGQGVVVYDFNGGTPNGLKKAEIFDIGEPKNLPASSTIYKSGYKLVGWKNSTDNETVYGPGYVYDYSDTDYIVFEAVWTNSTTNSVEFVSGSWTYTVSNVPANTHLATPMFSDRFELLGWSQDGSNYVEKGQSILITKNETYQAYNKAEEVPGPEIPVYHKVTFVTNGGSISSSSQTVRDGKCAVEPKVSKAGYLFNGWYVSGSSTPWSFAMPVTENIVLNAEWVTAFIVTTIGTKVSIEIPADVNCSSYVVKWGDGHTDTNSFHEYAENTSGIFQVTLYTAKYGNQTVWYPYAVGSNQQGDVEIGGEGDGINTFTVTFVEDSKVIQTQSVKKGACAEQFNVVGGGYYTFYRDASCTEKFNFTTPINEDITVFVQFTKVKEPVIEEDAGDHSAIYIAGTIVILGILGFAIFRRL